MAKSDKNGPSTYGAACCNCASSVGDVAKVQPVSVPDVTGIGPAETWCPRCFVWKRMHQEPDRFNASCTAVVSCQFCPWITVCFGVQRGAAYCGACGKTGAMLVRPAQGELEKMGKIILETAEEFRAKA